MQLLSAAIENVRKVKNFSSHDLCDTSVAGQTIHFSSLAESRTFEFQVDAISDNY